MNRLCPSGHDEWRPRRAGGRYCAACLREHARRRAARQALGLPTGRPTLAERFWAKVRGGSVEECWEWTAYRHPKGYGAISVGGSGGRPVPAHRVAYELLIVDIPDGLELDHLCRNPGCVNPWHLEPVTKAENLRRQAAHTTPRQTRRVTQPASPAA